MKTKLTKAQWKMLDRLRGSYGIRLDPFNRTLTALERHGFAWYYNPGGIPWPYWRVTPAGRAALSSSEGELT